MSTEVCFDVFCLLFTDEKNRLKKTNDNQNTTLIELVILTMYAYIAY